MAQLYRTFETESQKPGKVFHQLVRRRRRELGLPVPPEERVLPFRSHYVGTLHPVDRAIDNDGDDNMDEAVACADPSLANVNLLRVVRRLDELDLDAQEAERLGASTQERQRLAEAFEQELQTHATLLARQEQESPDH